ncbi:lysozyme g-like [Pelodiscus sinensis]|uniref:lysozyme g-like n=1 Tax=Pelodiscus sinensis TaxID=13735 RepID=UPI003F6C2C9B
MVLTLMILGLAALFGTSASQTKCYGDITKVDTIGASCKTAKAEGLSFCGVQASEKIAEKDLNNMNKYKAIIKSTGLKTCVDPALIAGIISRESHAGASLKNGWGDNGNAFGLMQVDKNNHKIVGRWNDEDHLLDATRIFIGMINGIKAKFPKWTMEQQLKGAVSAYNGGIGNVRSYDNMDIGTPGNDYASDATARAKFFKKEGY